MIAIAAVFSGCSLAPQPAIFSGDNDINLRNSFELSCGNIYAATMSVFDKLHYSGKTDKTAQELLNIGLDALPALDKNSPIEIMGPPAPEAFPLKKYLKVCEHLIPHVIASAAQSGDTIEAHLADITDATIEMTRDKRSGFELLQEGEQVRDFFEGRDNGLGARILRRNGMFIVTDVEKGRPAEQAGIKNGDIINAVNGKDASSLHYSDFIETMFKQNNDYVSFIIERDGQQINSDFTVTMDEGMPRNVSLESIGDATYLRIKQFTSSALDDVIKLLERKTLADGKPTKIIIDLEDDPGGEVSISHALTDLFLPQINGSQTISKRSSLNETGLFVSDEGREVSYGSADIAVLVNGNSASAAEDMAGALKVNSAARLYGSRTYGKGTVQSILPIGERGRARITQELFAAGGEQYTQCFGVEPDVKVMTQDYRDSVNHVLDPLKRETCDEDSIQSAGASSLIQENHEELCTLRTKYAGVLAPQTADSLPDYLKEYKVFKTNDGEIIKGYFFKAALACALSDFGQDMSQYVASRPNHAHRASNTPQIGLNN